jgi:nuclear cap-binding protein subunit 1
MTMDKLVGRVTGIQSRIKVVEREDEMARARKNAERLESGEGVGEDEDVEVTGE